MPTRNEIVTAARSFVGKGYVNGGRFTEADNFRGDCTGLIIATCRIIQYPFEDHPGPYEFRSLSKKMVDELHRQGYEVPIEDRKPGDIPTFWFDRHTKETEHCGILTLLPDSEGIPTEHLIHVYTGATTVAESAIDERWIKRMTHVFRFNNVTD